MEKEQSAPVATVAEGQGGFGLVGAWRSLGNASAMFVMLGCFVWMLWRFEQHAVEDRAACQERLKELRSAFDGLMGEIRKR